LRRMDPLDAPINILPTTLQKLKVLHRIRLRSIKIS
jgi:hypothetical protein